MLDLDAAERLDDFDQVLLQHGVVQPPEMIADERVAAELVAVVRERLLVFLQAAIRMGARDGFHGFEVLAGVFDGLLRGHEVVDVVDEVQHDFAEEHVLEGGRGFGRFVLRVVAFERFDEVGKGRVEVLVFGVQHAGLHVEPGLQEGRGVDGCGRRARGCQCRAGFGLVAEGVVDAGFEQLDFDEDEFVIEAFELFEEAVDESEGVVVGLLLHVEGYEARFEVLTKEASTFGDGPFDA